MIRSAAAIARPRRIRQVAALLATVATAGAPLRASSTPDAVSIETRIVEATLGAVSLERVDVSLRVALRASRAATIRSIAFTDAFVGRVPVWIERLEGDWPLAAGEELVLPQPMRVRIHARDALGTGDFGAIVRTGSVTVRASVEVGLATPWIARLFFAGPTRTLVREVSLDLPVQTGPSYLSPLTRMGADLADAAQRGAAAWFATGLNRLPVSSALVHRYAGGVATVTTRYGVDGAGLPAARERRAAGVWWAPGVFCTTREAMEPWRFDVGDATALQQGGARLRRDGGGIRVGATPERPAFDIAFATLDALLPSPGERKLYTLVDGRPRPLRLADRSAASNLVCLRVDGEAAPAAQLAVPASIDTAASADVAAFAPGSSFGIVWTSVEPAADTRLRIVTPLHRVSFGSPLVAADRLVGLVASPTTAWPAAVVESAAARAPRLPTAGSTAAPR